MKTCIAFVGLLAMVWLGACEDDDSAAAAVSMKPAEAAALYRIECRDGNLGACENLGVLYERGKGVVRDYDRATSLFEQACEDGEEEACKLAERTRPIRDKVRRARKACEAVDGHGCYVLGRVYESAVSEKKNVDLALQFYRKACDAGYPGGCDSLASAYFKGEGVDADLGVAKGLYEKACAGGSAYGCLNLGGMYREGHGMARDPAKAEALYLKACEAELPYGCTAIGLMYKNGDGVAKDPAKVKAFFKRACDAGLDDVEICGQAK